MWVLLYAGDENLGTTRSVDFDIYQSDVLSVAGAATPQTRPRLAVSDYNNTPVHGGFSLLLTYSNFEASCLDCQTGSHTLARTIPWRCCSLNTVVPALSWAGTTPLTGKQHWTARKPLYDAASTPTTHFTPHQDLQHDSFQTPEPFDVSDGDSSIDAEELEEVQELLAEKDEELSGESFFARDPQSILTAP